MDRAFVPFLPVLARDETDHLEFLTSRMVEERLHHPFLACGYGQGLRQHKVFQYPVTFL